MYLHGTSRINEQGHLEIGGCDTTRLAKQYGTPLYVYDEESIRGKCRAFHRAFKESGFSYQVAYASKAFLCMEMCRVAREENMSLDVVSEENYILHYKQDFLHRAFIFMAITKQMKKL